MSIVQMFGAEPELEALDALAGGEPFVALDGLRAGYGRMEILHGSLFEVEVLVRRRSL